MNQFTELPNMTAIKRIIITAIALSVLVFIGLRIAQFHEWILIRFVPWA